MMIIWQDDPFDGSSNSDLEATLVDRSRRFGKAVVLVHGDTHVYRLGRNWREAPNLVEVETLPRSRPTGGWRSASTREP